MQVIVYQMRRNGVEIARELLGDEAHNIGELRVVVFDDGDGRPNAALWNLLRPGCAC
ncbi:hypothetical protein [Herbaspirillum rubrisubalbicans]|uniref:hypothetical protein n=1 Tax=Herbaspirillum rubrisubalbicans TaxID=80842 RepID=UPI0002DC988F|nr:hypothetical protein [Herbaspirillum rubrisubalbicans]